MKKIILVIITFVTVFFVWKQFFKVTKPVNNQVRNEQNLVKSDDSIKASEKEYFVYDLPNNLQIVTTNQRLNNGGESAFFLPKEALEKMPKQVKKMDKFQRLMHQNISFYGQVVDQFDYPVSDVQLRIVVSQLGVLGSASNVPIYTKTDSSGRFYLNGIIGNNFKLDKASKDGYVFQKLGVIFGHQHKSIETSEAKPFKFKAWRIVEEPIELKDWEASVLGDSNNTYTTNLSIDPEKSSFNNRYNFRVGDDEDIVVKVDREYEDDSIAGASYDIQIQFNNGLSVAKDSGGYSFQAPTDGYQTVVNSKWNSQTDNKQLERYNQSYYIRGVNGTNYGRLKIYINPFWKDNGMEILLNASVNMTGSRNLLTKNIFESSLKFNELAYPQTSKSKFYREDKIVN